MPLSECGFKDAGGVSGQLRLQQHGPTTVVDIGFDPNYIVGQAPQSAAQQIPALIDTGALLSCIDDALALKLNLPLVDRQWISGVSGKHQVNMHMAQVHVPQLGYTQFGQFAGVSLTAGGQQHQVLLGRTFLHDFIMIYDGLRGQVTLAR